MKELVKKLCEKNFECTKQAIGNGLPVDDDVKIILAFANQCCGAIELAVAYYNTINNGANADSAELLEYHNIELNARFEELLKRCAI